MKRYLAIAILAAVTLSSCGMHREANWAPEPAVTHHSTGLKRVTHPSWFE